MDPILIPNTSRWNKAINGYLGIAVMLLLLAACSKGLSVWKPSAYLASPNSLLTFLSNRQLFLAVAALELAVAAAIVFGGLDLWTRVQCLFWLSLQFAVYRLILFLSKEPEPCKCFGDLFLWLGLGPSFVDLFSKASLAYFLVPSGAVLLWRGLQPKPTFLQGANTVRSTCV
jgi:hypothetical protein